MYLTAKTFSSLVIALILFHIHFFHKLSLSFHHEIPQRHYAMLRGKKGEQSYFPRQMKPANALTRDSFRVPLNQVEQHHIAADARQLIMAASLNVTSTSLRPSASASRDTGLLMRSTVSSKTFHGFVFSLNSLVLLCSDGGNNTVME